MPENPSTPDDRFADLYGKLPDARTARPGSSDIPTSRRAARAARETGTGETATPAASEAGLPTPVAAHEPEQPITREPAPPAARLPVPQPTARQAGAPTAPVSERPAGTATLDDLFTGERSTEQVGAPPPKKNKRRRRIGGWIAFGIVLALIGGVVAGGFWAWNTFGPRIEEFFNGPTLDDYEAGLANGETQITIASGDTGMPVSEKMFEAGVTKAESTLYDYLIQNSIEFPFQPGVYRLQLQMTAEDALAALENPENRMEKIAQLREGLTVETTIAAISEQTGIALADLEAATADPAAYGVASQNLEGWLFPATYTFDPSATAADVIRTMVERTAQSLDAVGVPVDDRQRVLTIASIIEREGRTPDFPKVSRVIQNRLDQGMMLQMDSTAQYGYGELHAGSASTSAEAQYDENEWNTYVIQGLPATPIANPGDAAIAAAMNPEAGPWLFFVTVNLDTGETVFTTTADEHQQAVDQWIDWCRDNPDSGC